MLLRVASTADSNINYGKTERTALAKSGNCCNVGCKSLKAETEELVTAAWQQFRVVTHERVTPVCLSHGRSNAAELVASVEESSSPDNKYHRFCHTASWETEIRKRNVKCSACSLQCALFDNAMTNLYLNFYTSDAVVYETWNKYKWIFDEKGRSELLCVQSFFHHHHHHHHNF